MGSELFSDEVLASNRIKNLAILLLVLVCFALFFVNIASLPLTDPDESRCVFIVQGMIETGNWLMPYLDGHIYFDKPAPFFWLSALGQKLTGSMEAGGRLVAAVAGLGAVLVTFFLTRRLAGTFTAFVAGIILATSPEFLFLARWYRMDMPFVFLMWAALCWFWRYESLEIRTKFQRRACWWGVYILCGLAVMIKGPAGIVLPMLVIVSYFVIKGQYRRIFEAISIPGIIFFVAIASPWYIAACLREPEYAYEFFMKHNLTRYAGKRLSHLNMPAVFYLAILIGGIAQWAILLPAAVEKKFPRKWKLRSQSPEILFLWTAAIVPLIFFGVAKTKMANYIAPVFPPVAILIAIGVGQWVSSKEYVKAYRHALLVLCFVLLLLPVIFVGAQLWMKWPSVTGTILAVAAFISAGCMARSMTRDSRHNIVLYACASVTLLFSAGVIGMLPYIYENLSYRQLAYTIRDRIKPEDKIVFIGPRRATFTLYAGLTEDKKIKLSDPNCDRKIAKVLAGASNVYFLVNGEKGAQALKSAATRPLFTVALRGDYQVMTTATGFGNTVQEFSSWQNAIKLDLGDDSGS